MPKTSSGLKSRLPPRPFPVLTENSVRSENTEVPIIREIMVATTMSSLLVALFALVASSFRTRAALQAEILALRHQLAVFQKNVPGRLRLQRSDRFLWVLLSRFWSGWRRCLLMVQADTVSTRKTAGEADLGAGVQRGSGTETAHKPASLAGHGVS